MATTKRPSKFGTRTIHKQAAVILKKLLDADGSKISGVTLKSLVFSSPSTAKKAIYALTCETLRYLPVIKELIATVNPKENRKNAGLKNLELGYILIYDLLFGLGKVSGTGPEEKFVLSNKNAFKSSLARLLVKRKVSNAKELLPTECQENESIPRYVRVNTLKKSMEEALEALKDFKPKLDDLVPNLLVLPAGTDLHNHSLVLNGSLVLQGKSSCIPPVALNPEPSWKIIDACAAPGNKTSQLAAIMEGKGKITAFELNPARFHQLKTRLHLMAATNVEVQLQDFLAVNPKSDEFKNTDAILLDPSCSGSGTKRQRLDHLMPSSYEGREEDTDARLEQLAKFQETALRHALAFPQVKRVVYSTCSVHQRENEEVVRSVLSFAEEEGFELETVLPSWSHRGLPVFQGAQHLLRMDAERDKTDGFFVASFVRKEISKGEVPQSTAEDTKNENCSSALKREGILRRRRLKRQRKKAANK